MRVLGLDAAGDDLLLPLGSLQHTQLTAFTVCCRGGEVENMPPVRTLRAGVEVGVNRVAHLVWRDRAFGSRPPVADLSMKHRGKHQQGGTDSHEDDRERLSNTSPEQKTVLRHLVIAYLSGRLYMAPVNSLEAIADPTRRRIVEMLARRDCTVSEIVEQFDMTAPAISQHLKVLREAGLVTSRVDGQSRIQSLNPAGLQQIQNWLLSTMTFWNQRLDALEAALRAEASSKPRTKTKS